MAIALSVNLTDSLSRYPEVVNSRYGFKGKKLELQLR